MACGAVEVGGIADAKIDVARFVARGCEDAEVVVGGEATLGIGGEDAVELQAKMVGAQGGWGIREVGKIGRWWVGVIGNGFYSGVLVMVFDGGVV